MSTSLTTGVGRWLRTLSRSDRVLLALVSAHVVLKLIIFEQVARAPLMGDETAYVNGGRALSNLLRDLGSLTSPDLVELQTNVVASGWFMPGMSVVTAPLFLVVPDAGEVTIRAYLGVITTLVLVATTLQVRRVLGPWFAGALLVVPGLIPTWITFSYAAWGDLMAGLVLILLVTGLVLVSRELRAGRPPAVAEGVRLAILSIAVVYLRASALLVVIAVDLFALLTLFVLLRGSRLWRALGTVACASLVFAMSLAPWSIFASLTLDGPVVTTTSVPIVRANTFGDRDLICFGPCDPGSSIWFSPLRYSRETARATGYSEMAVAKEMSAYALRDVTVESYARGVLDNFKSYASDPERFAKSLRQPDAEETPALAVMLLTTRVMVWFAFGVGAILLMGVWRGPREVQVLSVMLKLGVGALLAQPFVHISGPRYWTTVAPLLGLGVALLAKQLWPGLERPTVVGQRDAAFGRWLVALQALGAAFALVVVAVVVVAGVA